MSRSLPRFARLAHDDVPLADFVPYSVQVSPSVLRTRDGAYVGTWRIEGFPFEARDDVDVLAAHEAFNGLVRSLPGGEASLWAHRLRRRVSDRLSVDDSNAFCQELGSRYYDSFAGERMMATEHYLSLVWRPPGNRRGVLSVLAGAQPSFRERLAEQDDSVRRMVEFDQQLCAALAKFHPQSLGCVDSSGEPVGEEAFAKEDGGGPVYSEQLALYAYLLNGVWERVPVPARPVREALPIARLLFAGERLEIRAPDRSRYATVIELRDYPAHSTPGMLHGLLYESCEFIETHSFSVMTKAEGAEALRIQERQLIASGDQAASQIAEMSQAQDQLAAGEFVLGEYHYTLAVLGESTTEVDGAVAGVRAVLNDAGLQSSMVDLVADAAWFAQLPGNGRWRPRTAVLTSRNFCALSAFHNFACGKRDGNPWGEAVAILKTPSAQPYYFNFHATREGVDASDQKAPGHCQIIGATGQGKTVLELALLAFALRFGITAVCFDRDRGMEIAIRAMGGLYRVFESGRPTGMNPLQLEPTAENVQYWHRFVRELVGVVGTAESDALSQALQTLAGFPAELRRLTVLRQNVSPQLEAKLAPWCEGGRLGWVFDNPVDTLRFGQHRLYGFDDSALTRDPELAGPVTGYLLQSTSRLMDGRRFVYVIAEAWERLLDPLMVEFITAGQKTARKLNALGVFDTQSPDDMLRAPNARAMVEQAATLVFLPNPRASASDYIDGFGLTRAEFELLQTLPDGSRHMLIKQGSRCAVATLDLSGLDDLLDVLSSTEDNVRLLDDIRAEVGEDPARWRPVLTERIARRRVAQRRAA